MRKFGSAIMCIFALLILATPAFAQQTTQVDGLTALVGTLATRALGAGIVLFGAAIGFGKIGVAALEGMARQPEAASSIQPAMIIIAALLEGATFFALLVCWIA